MNMKSGCALANGPVRGAVYCLARRPSQFNTQEVLRSRPATPCQRTANGCPVTEVLVL